MLHPVTQTVCRRRACIPSMPSPDRRPFGVCDCFFSVAFCRGKARVACDACPNCKIALHQDWRTKFTSSVRYLTYIRRIFSFAAGTFVQPAASLSLMLAATRQPPHSSPRKINLQLARGPRAFDPGRPSSGSTVRRRFSQTESFRIGKAIPSLANHSMAGIKIPVVNS